MILHKARATHDLDGVNGGRFSDLDGLKLGSLGLFDEGVAPGIAVPGGRRTPDEQTSRIQFHRHLGNHEGDALVGDNGAAKGDAFFAVVHGVFERGASHTAGYACPQDVVKGSGSYNTVMTWLTEHIRGAYRDVIEAIRSAGSSDQAQLLDIVAGVEARSLFWKEQGAESVCSRCAFLTNQHDARDGVSAVDDVAFGSAEDIAFPLRSD